MNNSLLALALAISYVLFAVGSHAQLPLASVFGATDNSQAKRAKPAGEVRAPQARRG